MNTPLERVRDSKMSGEEWPLKVYFTQDKTQNVIELTNHTSRVF